MKTVFVDTSYWVAIISPHDQWHAAAKQARDKLGPARLVTTDAVLMEFLTMFSTHGNDFRKRAVKAVQEIIAHPNIRVVPQTHELFLKGLKLYKERPDKKYSLHDCISMTVMEDEKLEEILTSDHDFEREGFTILMKKQ